MSLWLGVDLGTSGLRACVIDAQAEVVAQVRLPAPDPGLWLTTPTHWSETLTLALQQLAEQCPLHEVQALAIDGTSASLLLCDASGVPVAPVLSYADSRAESEAATIAQLAPATAAVHGPSSGLAKLLWWQGHGYSSGATHLCSQADWLLGTLTGQFGASDPNNMLKLGYDPSTHCWPEWLDDLGVERALLPEVRRAGRPIAAISPRWASRLGLSPEALVCRGTTDSTAAFIATGLSEPGDGLTSLGSTLVIKQVSDRPIHAPEYGVYSQPLGERWLVGGASNSGGQVLRHFFSDQQLIELSQQIDPDSDSGLDYYPLLSPGERFPISDAQLLPRMRPRPADEARFLHAMLEGMARIETQGYALLGRLGAPPLERVATVGGGARNRAWSRLRERALGVTLVTPAQSEAAYGAALLAKNHCCSDLC